MKVDGRHFRSIWLEDDGWTVGAIDQRRLPHEFVVARIANAEDATEAIRSMLVRGAPLIGATAAYGMALAMRAEASDAALDRAYAMLLAARPTAINLKWALDEMRDCFGRCRRRNEQRRLTGARSKSPRRTSRSTRGSAGMVWR